MQVGDIFPARGGPGRHCFIKPGDTEAYGLHFFEQPNAQIFQYPEVLEQSRTIPGALQHLAFTLPGLNEALILRERLVQFGITVTPINTLGSIQNMLFRDNNGILLEAAWPKA